MNKTLLVVEDDVVLQRFYERLFRLHDYSVILASDGADGMEKAKKFLPSLILLDIMMPVSNGLDMLEKLKGDPETKELPVVLLTNFGEAMIIEKAMKLGAKEYLIKSDITDDKLMEVVEKYVK
jgi:CheY-like chemotaxis protein